MVIVGLLSWWYTAGWKLAAQRVIGRLAGMFDYFSIDILLTTLFTPFRQISAGRVDGPIGVIFQAFIDRLISRIIGACLRSIVILIGVSSLLIGAGLGVCYLLLWLVVPILPIVGLTLMLAGWVPWQL